MFDDNPTAPQSPLWSDLRARWVPTPAQVQAAQDAIAASVATNPDVPEDDWLAAVPLVMPGKTYGLWQAGQVVESVDGCWVGRNSATGVPSYADARNAASDAAREALGDRKGTVAWVTIDAAGTAAVFEDFPRV